MEYVARTPSQLGPILRSCRTQRGFSQQQAGAKVGIKQSTISAIENDSSHSSVDTLYKLLSALGLELVIRERPAVQKAGNAPHQEW